MTIKELRKAGYKVRVLHHRVPSAWGLYSARGGTTEIIIDSPSGQHFEGQAKCSEKDNYNKKLGVRIALGRTGILNT